MANGSNVKSDLKPESLSVNFVASTYIDATSSNKNSWAYKVGNLLIANLYIGVKENKSFSDWVGLGTISGWSAKETSWSSAVQRYSEGTHQYAPQFDIEISKTGSMKFYSGQTATYPSAIRIQIVGIVE